MKIAILSSFLSVFGLFCCKTFMNELAKHYHLGESTFNFIRLREVIRLISFFDEVLLSNHSSQR